MPLAQSNWRAVRDAIVEVLIGIPDIGNVHGYPRVETTKHAGRWTKLMVPENSNRIHAWVVQRARQAVTFNPCMQVKAEHSALVSGFLEHDDFLATQDAFDDQIDLVLTALWSRARLEPNTTIQGPAELTTEGFEVLAGGRLVHYCEITVPVLQLVHVERT